MTLRVGPGGLGPTVGRVADPELPALVAALFGPEALPGGAVRKDVRGLRHRLLVAARDASAAGGPLTVEVAVPDPGRRARVLTDVRTFLVRLTGSLAPVDLTAPVGPVGLPSGDELVVEVRVEVTDS